MKTDLKELQRVANVLLHCEPKVNEQFNFIVHHPFFQSCVYPIQENGGARFLDITKRDELEVARGFVKELIAKTQSAFDFLLLISKPYLPAFFKFANKAMSEEDFAKFLSEMWITVEFPNTDKNISPLNFVNLFKRANKDYLMSEKDKQVYDDMPDTITIYRGVRDGARVKALSWTTDIDTAIWFAQRWSDEGTVYSAEISKSDVLAYFGGRGEYEVVVDFRKLNKIEEVSCY